MLNLYRLFMKIADNYAPQFKITLIYTILSALMQSLAFLTLLPIFAALYHNAPFSAIFPWLCVLVLLVILQMIFKNNEWRFTYRHWHKLIEDKRLALGNVLYTMPLLKLKSKDSGQLVELIGTHVVTLVNALSQIGTLFVQMMTIPAILIIGCLLMSWQLGLLLLLGCLIMYPLFKITQRQQKIGFIESGQANEESAASVIEYIQGLIVFKATGHTGKNARRLNQAFNRLHEVQHRAHLATKTTIFAGNAVLQITLIILLLLGSLLIHYQLLAISTLAVVMILTVYISEPLGLLSPLNALFETAKASQEKIEAMLQEVDVNRKYEDQPIDHFDICFNDVQFAYGQQPVLQKINLTIRQNTITGLVGPSGSGKTTLTQLIAGFIHASQGTVCIGGVDISRLDAKKLLRYMAIVYQDVWLFNDSIKNNLLMGNPQASDEEIYQAARAANIHDFILSLPKQYDTPVGDIGAFLSGGEKQRISIARAILKNAPLVILDEPTSSLDSESEYQVQQALEALVKEKTVIVVAHRLSTVKGADNIVVLDAGRIVQQGNHDTLITQSDGLYSRLWQAQHIDD